MRACPNIRCTVFGRIVYSLTTRCPLCKWDLKPILPKNSGAQNEREGHDFSRAVNS